MTTYTLLGNTIRAARAALGKGAERNVHFKVTKHEDDTFSWSPVEDAPPVPAVAAAAPKPRVRKAKAAAAKAPVAATKAPRVRKAKAPKAPKAKRPRVSIVDQPANAKPIELMKRKNGVSAEEVAALGKMTTTSWRGLASKMGEVIKIVKIKKPGEAVRYHWDGHSKAAA